MTGNVLSHLARTSNRQDRDSFVLVAGLVTAASASASLIFACATPFAAFAALAGIVLPLRSAAVAVALSWLVNQAIGFGLLGYPNTLDTLAWGILILFAAEVATLAAAVSCRHAARLGFIAVYPLVLIASYAAYEVELLVAVPVLGGADAFTGAIVGHLAFVNAVWMIGLIAAFELLHRVALRATAGAGSRR